MDFGVSYFPTDESVEPAVLARMAEERGFESVFVTEHTHIPAGRETDYPAGGELPREYWRIYDPFVALTTMAAATERIRVGTAICLLVERDPITTAKAVASLDRLSGGRFLFGIGAGWNLEEMKNHGTDPDKRFRILRERVAACKAIWGAEEATYHGEFVNFDRIVCRPAPLQKPHPPILVGGSGPRVHERVLAYGDGWFPNRIPPDEQMIARVEELQRRGEESGRGPIPVSIQIPPRDPAVLERYEQAGVTRAVRMLRAGDAADAGSAERKLDEWTARIEAYTTG
ncbi:MAG TPA: LLM class F420-dependent oxidoreductase [Solirubrobacterales bacterium]|nr:LLM class F420-dependent oxidoreductase [Solirubrobacterales bacterium]